MKVMLRLIVALFFVFIIDAVSKVWTERNLSPFEPVEVLGNFFRLTLGYNTGVAFGMFSNGGNWPIYVTGGIILGLAVWFSRGLLIGHFPAWMAWPVGLLLGGALGNFIDRLPDGRVTDFLDVGIGTFRWPTFNLADSFILIAVGLMMLSTFGSEKKEPASPLGAASSENSPDNLSTNQPL